MTWSIKVIHIAFFTPSPNHFFKGVWCTNTNCTGCIPWNLLPMIILPPDRIFLGRKTQMLTFQKFSFTALTLEIALNSSHTSHKGAQVVGQIPFSLKATKRVSFSPITSMASLPLVSIKSGFYWSLLLTLLFLFRQEFHLWIWKRFKAVNMFHRIFEMQVNVI